MRIKLAHVFVDDQEKALQFYTNTLGFVKKTDFPMGEHRWLTVAAAEDPDGAELLLEPNVHPAAKQYQEALRNDGIPSTAFPSADIQGEVERLKAAGVTFTHDVTEMEGGPAFAIFDDTCGNLIQIYQDPGV